MSAMTSMPHTFTYGIPAVDPQMKQPAMTHALSLAACRRHLKTASMRSTPVHHTASLPNRQLNSDGATDEFVFPYLLQRPRRAPFRAMVFQPNNLHTHGASVKIAFHCTATPPRSSATSGASASSVSMNKMSRRAIVEPSTAHTPTLKISHSALAHLINVHSVPANKNCNLRWQYVKRGVTLLFSLAR